MHKRILLPTLATLLFATSAYAGPMCKTAIKRTQATGASIIQAYSSQTDMLANLDPLSPKSENILTHKRYTNSKDTSKRVLRRLVHTETPAYTPSEFRDSIALRLGYIDRVLLSGAEVQSALDELRVQTRAYILIRDHFIAQATIATENINRHKQAFPDATVEDSAINFEIKRVRDAQTEMRLAYSRMLAQQDTFLSALDPTAQPRPLATIAGLSETNVLNHALSRLNFIFGSTHPMAYYQENGKVYAWIVSDSTSFEETPVFELTTAEWNQVIQDQTEGLTLNEFNELFAQYLIQ